MRRIIRAFTIATLCLLSFSLQHVCVANTTRNIAPSDWQQLKADKAFSYKNDKEKISAPKEYKPGALQKFFRSFFEFFGSNFDNTLVRIIIICAVIYILYRLVLGNGSFLFGKSKKVISTGPAQPEEEDIASTNWEALLQEATNKNDFRLAVRYSYMWLLQLLQRSELIQYRIDKTNYEYYSELGTSQYKQSFRQLSRQYEYAWYGKFPVSPAAFNEYLALFNNVKNELKP